MERLFRYVTEDHCHIDDFLIITYTKAAAAELRSKIAAELSKRMAETPEDRHLRSQLLRVYQADIKTVDAFCTALLRENTHLLAQEGERYTLTPDFRVLDENDTKLLRQRVLTRVLERFYEELDEGGALLADTLGAGRDDSALENLVLETYEKLQSHADPEHWLAENRTIWETSERGLRRNALRRRAAGGHPSKGISPHGGAAAGADSPPWAGISIRDTAKNFCGPAAALHPWRQHRTGKPPAFLWTDWNFPGSPRRRAMTEDPEVVSTEGAVGERQNCRQKAGSHAGGQRYGGHGGPSGHGPCHD